MRDIVASLTKEKVELLTQKLVSAVVNGGDKQVLSTITGSDVAFLREHLGSVAGIAYQLGVENGKKQK